MEALIQDKKESKTQEKNYIDLLKKNDKILQNNFIKALKDPYFVRLVNALNVSDEVKFCYTSQLQEISLCVKTCENCKGLSFCPYDIKGVRKDAYIEDGRIKFIYKNCPYKDKMDKEMSYLKNVHTYKMPSEIRDASFRKVYKDDAGRIETIRYLKEFYDNYLKNKRIKALYLCGNFGCGKTYLVSALFNELAKKNIQSTIVYFPELLRSLKASFGNVEDNYDDKFNTVLDAPLLLLDDIGAEKLTDWARDEVLGVILQHRMEENLPTFFTSNLSLRELEEHLTITNKAFDKVKARRIIERIKYLSNEMKMIGANRRE